MTTSTITVADMQDKLLTLDQVRERLAATEPLSTTEVPIGTSGITFQLDSDWADGVDARPGTSAVAAAVTINGEESQLTQDALLEATSAIGLTEAYVRRSPSQLIEPQLNYWFRHGLQGPKKELQLLRVGELGAAFTKASVNPFSNLRLMDEAIAGIERAYGAGNVLADYKMTHSLRQTAIRLIVPEQMRQLQDTGREQDNWSAGLQIKNSLIGSGQTEFDAYLFAWWCTNGAITTQAEQAAVWSRRGNGGNDAEEVYQWAATAVDDVLGGMEHALDAVQAMVHQPVAGDARDIFDSLFTEYRVPTAERLRILENFAGDPGGMTMYAVMNAVTAVANQSTLDAGHVERLMRAGGQLPAAQHTRCGACHRVSI